MSAKKQTVKYIIYCLIILGCDLLQNVQGLFPEVWGARCFLLLPVTIILAMGEDEKNGAQYVRHDANSGCLYKVWR